jgi:hypothetical protein
MTPLEITVPKVVSFDDLRRLALASEPALTVSIAIREPTQIQQHLKNALRGLEEHLKSAGIDSGTASALLEPIHALTNAIESEGDWGLGMLIFRSTDVFRYFPVREPSKEFVTVGRRFQIRPLLHQISHEQRFYLLALSQKHVRLFHCTTQRAEEVQLPPKTPRNLEEFLHNRIPDHVLDNRSSGGPSTGSMKGVVFGTSSDRERQDEYLHHFYKEIDKGIHPLLRTETAPLILAGVEYEIPLYRNVNTYPRLLDDAVHGSPDGLTPHDLHARALKIVRKTFSPAVEKARSEVEEYRGTRLASTDPDEILKRAHEGRISNLLIREDAVFNGVWDEATQQAQTAGRASEEEDLLNLAALVTAQNRGQVFGLEAKEMPGGLDAAAILRF